MLRLTTLAKRPVQRFVKESILVNEVRDCSRNCGRPLARGQDMADIGAIAEEVVTQLRSAGAQAAKEGMFIFLPHYLDAEEIETLEMTLEVRSRTRYEIKHHLGERLIWVRLKPGDRGLW